MKTTLLFLAMAGLLGACANTNDAAGDARVLTVPLQAGPQNRGEIAEATLVARGEATDVNFFIGGVPSGTTRPLQLLTFIYPGSGAQLGPQPAYAMNSTVHATIAGGGWKLGKTVPVALTSLRGGKYSIVVRTTPADRNLDIFCGTIQ